MPTLYVEKRYDGVEMASQKMFKRYLFPPRLLSGCGIVLLGVVLPVAAAAFLMGAKSKNARSFDILAHFKDPQVVKINPEPSTTARLIACVASAR